MQYNTIGHYLKKECHLIEPQLLAELTDHFTDSIKAAMENGKTFEESFAMAKTEFGGEVGLQKIQRTFQGQALRFYTRGTLQELASFFRKPYLFRTVLFCVLTTAFIFYYNLRLFGLGESDFWDGGIFGGLTVAPLIVIISSLQSKLETGSFSLQTRYWFTAVLLVVLVVPLYLGSFLIPFLKPPYPQFITTVCVLSSSLLYVAYARYSQRKLFPEYAWLQEVLNPGANVTLT